MKNYKEKLFMRTSEEQLLPLTGPSEFFHTSLKGVTWPPTVSCQSGKISSSQWHAACVCRV